MMDQVVSVLAEYRWVTTGLSVGFAYFILQPDPRKLWGGGRRRHRDR